MNYQKFALVSQPWMKAVCSESFAKDVFSSLEDFEFLNDYDFDGNLVVGFRILRHPFLSMGDMVCLNQICSKHGCFYVIRPSATTTTLFVNFYLESHG